MSELVGEGKVVSIHYTLTMDDGQQVDSSAGKEPLLYLHGEGNIIQGLEQELTGKAVGDSLKVRIAPELGYGPRIDEAVQQIPRSEFPPEMKLEVGTELMAQTPDGQVQQMVVVALDDAAATVDMNHPLAGQHLNFDVQIMAVRDATAEEKQQGHVQGADDEDAE